MTAWEIFGCVSGVVYTVWVLWMIGVFNFEKGKK